MRYFILKQMMRLGFIAMFFVPLFATADEGQRLLDKFIVGTKTMTADFSQSLRTADGEILQASQGKFYLHKPGKFRWNYTLPYAQEIVSDGENIWIYDVDLQQITVQKQALILSNTPMSLIQDKVSVNAAFDIKTLNESDGIYKLLLTAKTDSSDFKKIILGVNNNGLQSMQFNDQFGQTTKIIFTNVTTNGDIDASVFDFQIPEGADVFGGH